MEIRKNLLWFTAGIAVGYIGHSLVSKVKTENGTDDQEKTKTESTSLKCEIYLDNELVLTNHYLVLNNRIKEDLDKNLSFEEMPDGLERLITDLTIKLNEYYESDDVASIAEAFSKAQEFAVDNFKPNESIDIEISMTIIKE